ncbi:porin family protein [Termitidicoccus mucosus]|uniref:outer membrane beta-barrel protein n=1 Tax=Termitidicoccus mucosus TaxID=1184151 RepID=UPI002FEE1149
MSKTILLTIGLLAAGAISFARQGGAYVLPKDSGPNFYLEAGPGFMKADLKTTEGDDVNDDLGKFVGGSLSFGWRISPNHKIQIEAGGYVSDAKESGEDYSWKADITAIPVLVSYSYCVQLDQAGRCELRLTPTLGSITMQIDEKEDDPSGHYSASVSDTTYAVGAGVGITYHLSSKFYVDAGYRFLRLGKTEYSFYDDEPETGLKAANSHWVSVTFGWKF